MYQCSFDVTVCKLRWSDNGGWINTAGADPGCLKGGVHLRSTSQKKGGSKRGSNFWPNVKKPTSWSKRGGSGPPGPPPPLDPLLHCVT